MAFGSEGLLIALLSEDKFFAVVGLPHTVIEPHAVFAAIAEKGRIAGTILWVSHISVTVHLKPVHVFLLWHTDGVSYRCEHDYPLFQLVETQLHIVIDHTVVADATRVEVDVALVIGQVVPQPRRVLRFYHTHIQARKIRGRGNMLLTPRLLYDNHHTGKYHQ